MPLVLGPLGVDVSTRPLVIGVLPAPVDGRLDDLCRRADVLVADGADVVELTVGADGDGRDEEELRRLVPAVSALVAHVAVPVAVTCRRATVARACFDAGAAIARAPGGLVDPQWLDLVQAPGAAVVAVEPDGTALVAVAAGERPAEPASVSTVLDEGGAAASAGAVAVAVVGGARVLRVADARAARRAVDVLAAIQGAG